MKIFTTLILSLWLSTSFSQTATFNLLLDSAKTQFKLEKDLDQADADAFDYKRIVLLLEKAIELKPDDAEARYFLAYAYSRLNSSDGRSIIDMNLELLYKTSAQLEKVIEISPNYQGEIIALDPYSKITSEWGSMAMKFRQHNQIDSAAWAFSEGKKRGGFNEYMLALNRNVLDACSKDAILISSGDNFTIPLWYLQVVEEYRSDVSVVDVALLNTVWYPKFLVSNKMVAFDLPESILDTLEFTKWSTTKVKIENFSWMVEPIYGGQYLLRGDQLLLSLLKENKFKRDVFFTIGFPQEARLGLEEFMNSQVVIHKMNINGALPLPFAEYKSAIKKALATSKLINVNSTDQLLLLDMLRFDLFDRVNSALESKDYPQAKELFDILDQFVSEEKYPYQGEKAKKYDSSLRAKLKAIDQN